MINHIGTKFLTILIILTLIAVVIAPAIIFMFAWGFYFDADPTKFNLATDMLRKAQTPEKKHLHQTNA
jgi:putative peptidoglycan lipid II flippase